MNNLRIVLIVLMVLGLNGCFVSQDEHKAVEARLSAMKDELEAQKKEIKQLAEYFILSNIQNHSNSSQRTRQSARRGSRGTGFEPRPGRANRQRPLRCLDGLPRPRRP